ncbi:hypothetical protein N1028_05945 [Herbiconiux sp. CPCC 203407]|uniref:Acyl-CoA dehydrogenase C-terminal domain-containing protein n=1 Tax=Herbiconiux oxytropis TaxID=2970915 RepID=A0AA42BUJ8_9MICO|nr:hypothetical protein [Herbiconiux oxytropis]MCS5723910.1 hypothetical protein [Herbiconiux oxytropis]MCS5725434.1 hypothetical protein [Herbiconiux oxytropis]
MSQPTRAEPTPDELVERAASMRELLRDGQEAAEQQGGYPEAIRRLFVQNDFYRIIKPVAFGGLGYDLETFFRVGIEISRGDAGVGWNFILGAGHTLHLASWFPESTQRTLLEGDDADPFTSPMRLAPPGTAERVDGGYVVDGTWDYCSGSTFSTHAILGCVGRDPETGVDGATLLAIVPCEEFTVLDDWGGDRTLGMRASGSNSVRVERVFVPDGFVTRFNYRDGDLEAGDPGTVGYRLHRDPLYLARTLTYFNAELICTQIGNAYAALDEYEHLLRTKKQSYPPRMPRIDAPENHRWFGEIMAKTDAAETTFLGALRQHKEYGRLWASEGRPFRTIDDVRIRAVLLQAAQLALGAVDLAFATAGSSSAKRGARMQKYYRDAAMYRTHIATQFDVVSASSAAHYLGGPLVF